MTKRSRVVARVLASLGLVLLSSGRVDAAHCTISTTSVNFGSYDVFSSTPTDTTGTVSVTCSGNADVTITLSKGGSATFSPRTLNSGTDTLNYNLYRDAARTTIWGDGTGSTASYTQVGLPNNTAQNLTIYARIPAAQDVRAGTYTDSVTVTIDF
jgi:spore coat protein U domain-containing protein, fimbrial subunit CupE1/2/3/6